MKIRDITAVGLRGATPPGGWSQELRPDDVVHTIVTVRTDEGVTGHGSVFTSDALVRGALEVLAPMVVGEHALEPERVAEKLHRNTFWQGRGGTITHTIGGIDLAMWDILGKVTGQPVGRLLGGRHRDRVLAYASMLAEPPGPLGERISALAERGFRAFKIGWGVLGRVDAATDEAVVRAARDAAGDAAILGVDVGGSDAFWPHGYSWALRTARMLAGYGVAWLEEPLDPDALDDFVALRRHTEVPISGGEVLTRRQSFQPFLEQGAFDVVQPDVTKVGGLGEQRRIGWTAEAHGIRLIPHGWNTAVGLAADLQLASALPTTDLVEYCVGSAYIDELAAGGWSLGADGMLPIPDTPGLGVELDPDALARYGTVPDGQVRP